MGQGDETVYTIIGEPTPRVESRAKVSGAAKFTADIDIPDVLWGKALHSPYAHARILRIDVTKARELSGVHAVITGADVGRGLYGRLLKDIPALAQDRVRFIGERVAAVAAVDKETARRALALIEIEYEELPAIFDPIAALEPDAPILHPDFGSYPGARAADEPSNGFARTLTERGDINAALATADVVVENTFRLQRMHQAYLEPQSVMVALEAGRVQVWTGSKTPYNAREALATAVGVPEASVVLHPVLIGGDFGGKGTPSEFANLLLPREGIGPSGADGPRLRRGVQSG